MIDMMISKERKDFVGNMSSLDEIEAYLTEVQSKKRFLHTRGVQYTSICLAMRYGIELDRASYAGLLHDCAKHLSGQVLLDYALRFNIPVSDSEKASPFLLHGKVGAHMAEDRFGIKDPVILDAIRYHTTGRPAMSMLEKIVFTADYIEPERNQAPNLKELRQLAFQDIDACIIAILRQTLDYLRSSNNPIDLTTQMTYDDYISRWKDTSA